MSADEQSMRRVTAIRNGTVIDHIPGGMVLQALQIFNVDGRHSNPISLASGSDLLMPCIMALKASLTISLCSLSKTRL